MLPHTARGCSLSKRGIPYQKHVTMENHLKTRTFVYFPLFLFASEILRKEEPECVPIESHPCAVFPGSLLPTISSNINLSVKPPCCRLPGSQGILGCSHVVSPQPRPLFLPPLQTVTTFSAPGPQWSQARALLICQQTQILSRASQKWIRTFLE